MTGKEAAARTVASELVLARECLAEARYALAGGFHRLARARAYYACFHAATAVFAARGRSFRRHTGLHAAIDMELVKTSTLPSDCLAKLRRLYQARLRSDYGDVAPTTANEAAEAVADAEAVLDLLIPLAGRNLNAGS